MGTSTLQFPSLDAAIAKFENVNPAFNNPGGVTQATANYYWPGTTSAAGPGTSCPGCAVFPTYEAGTQAQDAIVSRLANSGYSLQDFIAKYSGAQGDTLSNYVQSVSKDTGIAPGAPASSAAGSSPSIWDQAMNAIQTGNWGRPIVSANAPPRPASQCSSWDIPCQIKESLFADVGRMVSIVLGLIFIVGGIIILAAQGVVGVAESKHVRTISRAAAIAA